MSPEIIETRAHTTPDGMLNLNMNVGVADVDVTVTVRVRPMSSSGNVSVGNVDANGWPQDFFEQVAGSMPELRRAPQGPFEERQPFE